MRASRALAVFAAVLGLAAAFAGSPYRQRHAEITAIDLAQWIKERRPSLRIVDLRAASDFDGYHIPGAERIPLESIAQRRFGATDTIVLYSDGAVRGGVSPVGSQSVFSLRGGLDEWLDQVMSPTILESASPAERAEFSRVSALSRYFGGVPQTRAASDSSTHARLRSKSPSRRPDASRLERVRRRGC